MTALIRSFWRMVIFKFVSCPNSAGKLLRFIICRRRGSNYGAIQLPTQAVAYRASFDMPFNWSIHPILKIEEGMRVSLPAGVESVRVDATTNSFLGGSGSLLQWPQAKIADLQPIDLSRVPANEFGQAYKLYTHPLNGHDQVETAILNPAGEHSLAFRFRPDEITHVGLWMNYGAWSGSGSEPYFNLGLESCIGGTDALTNAKELGEYGLIPTKQTRDWTLKLLLS